MKNHFCSLKPVCFLFVFILSLSFAVAGQTVEKRLAGKTIIGGVINGKARTLPKPEYPEAARDDGIGGQVKVQVLIDESGTVVSANAVGGVEDLSLRQASEAAALQATFAPTLLSGEPVRVSGVITYNFVPAPTIRGNEQKLKLFGLSTFLTVAKSFSNDAGKLKKSFEGEDLLGDMVADFPEFSAELRNITAFESLTPEKRIQAIDDALAAIRTKVGESERWQMDVGIPLGRIFGPMFVLMESGADPSAMSNFDEAEIKGHLSKLAILAAKPPADFPKDVLEKLTAFAALAERENLLRDENFTEFGTRIVALAETISPEEK